MTAADAAARLGVKRQTIYAYVSRGLLPRRVAADGRTSVFDAADIDRLRAGAKNEDGELQTLIATGLTKLDDQTLWIRGHDLIGLIASGLTFENAVELLWAGPEGEAWSFPAKVGDGATVDRAENLDINLLDGLRIVTARCSAQDPLRHELSPKSVRTAGRRLILAMAHGRPGEPRPTGSDLPSSGSGPSPMTTASSALWHRLTAAAADDGSGWSDARVRALDVALALLVDHGLAGSTFAARIAASVRADPYAVVGAGLGVLGGALHGAASSAVHELLIDAEHRRNTAAALGDARRRFGYFPGVGHSIYVEQDPRYGALMARLVDAWGDDPRLVTVYRLRDLVSERTDAIPNIDLALGSLTYLARMPPGAGEAIFAIARTAGWLAHAMEEYEEKPLRFRARAKYTGP